MRQTSKEGSYTEILNQEVRGVEDEKAKKLQLATQGSEKPGRRAGLLSLHNAVE